MIAGGSDVIEKILRASFFSAGLSVLVLAALVLPVPAQAQKQIAVNSFKSSTLWPIWAAQRQGFFERHGVTIKNMYTGNSVNQMVGAIKGEFDLITTALDNVMAYDEGEGSPEAPKEADLIAFMGGNNAALTLIARPEIESIKDLKGRDLAVDAISTGFSFVLQEILAQNGLTAADYKLVPFGNTNARWQALQKNQAVAGLLTPPISQTAIAQGYVSLAEAAGFLGGYQGVVAATRRDWAKANPDAVVGFIRGYREGLDWLRAPSNRPAAIAILVAEIPETTPALAEETYAVMVADPHGFDAGGKLDLAGVKRVFDLRRRYGPQGKPATDVARFVDETYFDLAVKP
jgi:ABC-type nitrate/sulfonate/bicarbonate transport system substrate-binding protein